MTSPIKFKTANRPVKMGAAMLIDAAIIGFSAWAAYALRLSELFVPNLTQLLLILAAPAIAIPLFWRMRFYSSIIHYLSEKHPAQIFYSMALVGILWATLAFLLQATGYTGMPRSVPILMSGIGLVLISAFRLAVSGMVKNPALAISDRKLALIYGTGDAARSLAANWRSFGGYYPIAFIDPDPTPRQRLLAGLRVYPRSKIDWLIRNYGIEVIIHAEPQLTRGQRAEVLKWLLRYPVRLKIVPINSGFSNEAALSGPLRDPDAGDLIGTDYRLFNRDPTSPTVSGSAVMVTGAGGSIGSELSRQLAKLNPSKMVLVESSEPALYQVERQLRDTTKTPMVCVLDDLGDRSRIAGLIKTHGVEVIYHAAAYKHVGIVERNLAAGVRNNIFATLNLACAAFESNVKSFVLISTDKAVRPTTIMGLTKKWAEAIILDFAERSRGRKDGAMFCAVRFGNVIGSSGSVIPLFKEQIAHGGPVTVTDPKVERYFISIQEAVDLVIRASEINKNGKVFSLDLAQPVRIMELAKMLIRLHGRTVRDKDNPDGDISIAVTSLDPVEKLSEELFIDPKSVSETVIPHILQVNETAIDGEEFAARIEELRAALEKGDDTSMRDILFKIL